MPASHNQPPAYGGGGEALYAPQPSPEQVLAAANGLMARVEQTNAFRQCYPIDAPPPDRTKPSYWVLVADFAKGNPGLFEKSFGTQGAKLAQLVFATPAFVYASAEAQNGGTLTQQRANLASDDTSRWLYRFNDLLRDVMTSFPDLPPTVLPDQLQAAAQIGNAHQHNPKWLLDRKIRGTQAELDFERLTEGFQDMVIEPGNAADDAEGVDYFVTILPKKHGGSARRMMVDIKAGDTAFDKAIAGAHKEWRMDTEANDCAVLRYGSGKVKVILRPHKINREGQGYRLSDSVVAELAPALHATLLSASNRPDVCQRIA